MGLRDLESEPSEAFLEIGRKFYPRYRRERRRTRSYDDGVDWARTLDWRSNPYDGFLLRRELFLYFEREMHERPQRSVFRYATQGEVQAEIDRLLDEFPAVCERVGEEFDQVLGAFSYVIVMLPLRIGSQHRYVRYSRLAKALGSI